MLKIIGLVFVVAGIITIFAGDKPVGNGGGGIIEKLFTASPKMVKRMKPIFGVAMIYVGVQFILAHR